jgi:hypothetical protein
MLVSALELRGIEKKNIGDDEVIVANESNKSEEEVIGGDY